MNFLTKTLGSFAGYNIPYNFGDKIQESISETCSSNSIWTIYDGASKADGFKCTIFEFEIKNPHNGSYISLARNAAKKLKSTRIPGVLKVYDTLETDTNIYMFSESVVPLTKYLTDNTALSSDAMLLGIYILTKTLKHINVEGSSVHGNIDISSIFVSESGEWRLGGFELLTNTVSDPEQAVYRYSSASPVFGNIVPPEVSQRGIESLRSGQNQILKLDSYKFGGLIWCLFNSVKNSSEITNPSQFLSFLKIPKALQPAYKKLMQNSIAARITIEVLLNQGEKSFFSTNELIGCYKELDELNLKSNSEKLDFMKSLENIKTICPPGFMEYKIIPELIRLFNISIQPNNYQQDASNTATCLYYILSFSEKLDKEVFKRTVNPVIVQGFQLPDRTIRVTLLTTLPKYIEKLSKSEISDRIFTNLLTGFSDTNPTVREETLKAILPISSKLSDRQLNNELLRYLAKLQNDEKPEIRTNTIICLCKIAKNLNNGSRPGVLITAFNKSLKDKFVPARAAALLSFETCIEFFSPEICCSRVLSSVAPCLLDKSAKVRKQARKVFELYMAKIETEAERLPAQADENEEDEETLNTADGAIRDHKAVFASSNKEAANLTSNIQKLGFSLAMGAFTKMSGIGGQLEPTKNAPSPLGSRSATPIPSSFFSAGADDSRLLNTYLNGNSTEKNKNVAKKPIVSAFDDSFADDGLNAIVADDGWGFDVDEETSASSLSNKQDDSFDDFTGFDAEEGKALNQRVNTLSIGSGKKKPLAKAASASATLGKSKNSPVSSFTLKKSSGIANARKTSGASKGLKLGSKKNNESSNKLELNLTVDGSDPGWGDGW